MDVFTVISNLFQYFLRQGHHTEIGSILRFATAWIDDVGRQETPNSDPQPDNSRDHHTSAETTKHPDSDDEPLDIDNILQDFLYCLIFIIVLNLVFLLCIHLARLSVDRELRKTAKRRFQVVLVNLDDRNGEQLRLRHRRPIKWRPRGRSTRKLVSRRSGESYLADVEDNV